MRLLTFPKLATGFLALCATIVLWAGAFPAISLALKDFDPVPLAAIRFGLASIALGILLASTRRPSLTKRDVGIAALCGAIGIAAYNVLLNTGEVTISGGVASFIIGVQPLFAAFLAGLFLKECVTPRQLAGIVISILGLAVIMVLKDDGATNRMSLLLVTLAAMCSGGSFVFQRPIIARLGLFVSTPLIVMSGAACLSPWLGVAIMQLQSASPTGLAALAYLAFGAGTLGYLTWAHALNVFGAARACTALFLMAPTAAYLDFIFEGTIPSAGVLFGCGLACLGVAIGTLRLTKKENRTASRPSRRRLEARLPLRGDLIRDLIHDDY